MAVSETDVGIVAFTDDYEGFSAILKHTWRDFHVNEIGMDGEVLRLSTLHGPKREETEMDRCFEDCVKRFGEIVGIEEAKKIEHLKTPSIDLQYIQLGPINDKQQRTMVHGFFKNQLPGFPTLVTETMKEQDSTFIRVTPFSVAKKNKQWDKRNRTRASNTNVDGEWCRYLHFVLYKENIDNQMAISMISRALGVPPTVFRMAGTKDKRGITTQLVAGQNVDMQKLAGLNNRLQGVKVGNFKPSKDNIFIGDLQGNQFRIVLRNLQPTNPTRIHEACENLKVNGFLNYFGLQRFGQGSPTHLVGSALLKGHWKQAAHLILQSCPSDNPASAHAKELFFKEDIQGALEALPKKALSERALLEGYVEFGEERHLQAINRIHRNTRTLYVHAYQSYVWNQVITKRVHLFGSQKVLEGDIVLQEDDHCAKRKAKDRLKLIHFITKEDLEMGKYSIEDVVIPIPGASIQYPKNEMERVYQEIADCDGVSLKKSPHKVKDFSIEKVTGDYRNMVVKVPGLEYELKDYMDSYEPLLDSDLELLQQAGVESSHFPDLSMPDDLGKRKPEEDVEEGEAKKMKLEGEEAEKKVALKLQFKLPSSSYATMVIRQLTKYSTSKLAQKTLTTDNCTK